MGTNFAAVMLVGTNLCCIAAILDAWEPTGTRPVDHGSNSQLSFENQSLLERGRVWRGTVHPLRVYIFGQSAEIKRQS